MKKANLFLTYKKIILIILFLFLLCISSCSLEGNNDLFSNAMQSIVELKCVDDSYESYGTAIYIGNNRYITNCHVVTYNEIESTITYDEYYIRTAYEETYHTASLIKYDIYKDLAILESHENVCDKIIEFAKIDEIITGMEVFAIGNTQNQGLSMSMGIISNSRIKITYSNITMEMIASDAYISEGNSGGALINRQGKLLGVTTLRLKDKLGNIIYGMGYAIPIDTVEQFILDCS